MYVIHTDMQKRLGVIFQYASLAGICSFQMPEKSELPHYKEVSLYRHASFYFVVS